MGTIEYLEKTAWHEILIGMLRSTITSPVRISVNWTRTSMLLISVSSSGVLSVTASCCVPPPGASTPSLGSKVRMSRVGRLRAMILKPTSYLPLLKRSSDDACSSTTLKAPKSRPSTSSCGHLTSTSIE